MFNKNLVNLKSYELPVNSSFKYKLDMNENQSIHSPFLYKYINIK